MISGQNILFVPLDWGLGHYTRCVPLMRKYRGDGCNIFIAGNTFCREFYEKELDFKFTFLFLQGYDIKYNSFSITLGIVAQLPKIFLRVKQEQKSIKRMVSQNNISLIISDNRFGCYHPDIECVYITHQLQIKAGMASPMANYLHHHFIKKYNKCWVPDMEGENSLAGDLSKNLARLNVEYIGWLSRFDNTFETTQKSIDFLVLLSGLEPQRTQLERKLDTFLRRKEFENSSIAFVSGNEINTVKDVPANWQHFPRVNGKKLQELLLAAKLVVCRSGYSTLMELKVLNIPAVIIPTKGQTEQEYLAKYLENKHRFVGVMSFEQLQTTVMKLVSS